MQTHPLYLLVFFGKGQRVDNFHFVDDELTKLLLRGRIEAVFALALVGALLLIGETETVEFETLCFLALAS